MIKWNEYTWYSKLLAVIFFVAVLPTWTFYIGTQYEKTKVFLLTNTSNDSLPSSIPWKTYQNKNYGIEFKYPADFVSGDAGDSTSEYDIQLMVTQFDKNNEPIMDNRVEVFKYRSWDVGKKSIIDIAREAGKEPFSNYKEEVVGKYTYYSADDSPLVVIYNSSSYFALRFSETLASDDNFVKKFVLNTHLFDRATTSVNILKKP